MNNIPSAAAGRVRLYLATSLDGFIADADGDVGWLGSYDPRSYGYDAFLAGVGAIILGRRTYEHICTFGEEWPYAGKNTIILTSRPPQRMPRDATHAASLALALGQARKIAAGRDVWIAGGAQTMRSAIEGRVVDCIDVFVTPVLLGRGLSMLAGLGSHAPVEMVSIQTYPDGVVQLSYDFPRQPTRSR